MAEALLELAEITKTYPGVVALDRVSLSVGRGEVLGLIGENGAGKSTLMKILGGVIEPTSGVIRIDGPERRSLSVADAIAARHRLRSPGAQSLRQSGRRRERVPRPRAATRRATAS